MRNGSLNPEKNRALLAAFRNFVNDTGIGHSEIAHELGISPWTILQWMHGTIKLRSPTLVAIKCLLERKGSAYLRAAQQDNQVDREQSKWHSFLQYPWSGVPTGVRIIAIFPADAIIIRASTRPRQNSFPQDIGTSDCL
jgi:hypothetical protein